MESFIDEHLSKIGSIIEDSISALLNKMQDDMVNSLYKGKFLRSRLGLKLLESTPDQISDKFHYTCGGVELIHSASLIHDDIIDGGEIRRGNPTFWKRYGTSSAVILGDTLFSTALEILSRLEDHDIHKMFAFKIKEMCEGELYQDIIHKNEALDYNSYLNINKKKTGALFSIIGFVSANGDAEMRSAMEKVGYNTGIAYQFIDDMIDEFGCETKANKTLGTDNKKEASTAVSFFKGNEGELISKVENFFSESIELLSPWPEKQQGYMDYISETIMPIFKNLCADMEKQGVIVPECSFGN